MLKKNINGKNIKETKKIVMCNTEIIKWLGIKKEEKHNTRRILDPWVAGFCHHHEYVLFLQSSFTYRQ